MEKKDALFEAVKQLNERGSSVDIMDKELTSRYGETCATFVLDSTGFTRVTKSLGTAYFLSIIQKMRAVCVDVFNQNHVTDWRCFADNMFAEFPSVEDAIRSAFAIHQHFEKNPVALMNEDDLFGVCVGIGYGRVIRSEHEGVYGDEMNLASKLGEDVASGFETLITEAAKGAISNPRSLTIEPRRLKLSGVDVPVYNISPLV